MPALEVAAAALKPHPCLYADCKRPIWGVRRWCNALCEMGVKSAGTVPARTRKTAKPKVVHVTVKRLPPLPPLPPPAMPRLTPHEIMTTLGLDDGMKAVASSYARELFRG